MLNLLPWITLALILVGIWGIYCWIGNSSIIDVVWALGITWCGWGYSLINNELTVRSTIILLLLLVWALRLSGFLWWTRIKPKHTDPRYDQLSQNWYSLRLGFLLNYQFQGLLMAIIALPFYWNTAANSWHITDSLGIGLVLVGIVGETIADYQLHRFKLTKTTSKTIMNQGLWAYSRHPNYFFECLVWLGFAACALSINYGWLALISPILLLSIMLGITLPMTEKQALQSKGEAFRQYQQTTSAFVPLPPNRHK